MGNHHRPIRRLTHEHRHVDRRRLDRDAVSDRRVAKGAGNLPGPRRGRPDGPIHPGSSRPGAAKSPGPDRLAPRGGVARSLGSGSQRFVAASAPGNGGRGGLHHRVDGDPLPLDGSLSGFSPGRRPAAGTAHPSPG